MDKYICKCGREFKNNQALNRHKGFCLAVHPDFNPDIAFKNVRAASAQRTIKQKQKTLDKYNASPVFCKQCGKKIEYCGHEKWFCSSSCAASYNNVRRAKSRPVLQYQCELCCASFDTETKLRLHYAASHKEYYMSLPYEVCDNKTDEVVKLDISKKDMLIYRQTHTQCEICGRSVDDLKQNDKIYFKTLCVDHEHPGNHFRGLLCTACNVRLGWFEHNKDVVLQYLTRNNNDSAH